MLQDEIFVHHGNLTELPLYAIILSYSLALGAFQDSLDYMIVIPEDTISCEEKKKRQIPLTTTESFSSTKP